MDLRGGPDFPSSSFPERPGLLPTDPLEAGREGGRGAGRAVPPARRSARSGPLALQAPRDPARSPRRRSWPAAQRTVCGRRRAPQRARGVLPVSSSSHGRSPPSVHPASSVDQEECMIPLSLHRSWPRSWAPGLAQCRLSPRAGVRSSIQVKSVSCFSSLRPLA